MAYNIAVFKHANLKTAIALADTWLHTNRNVHPVSHQITSLPADGRGVQYIITIIFSDTSRK
jgi:hypothetical protein